MFFLIYPEKKHAGTHYKYLGEALNECTQHMF